MIEHSVDGPKILSMARQGEIPKVADVKKSFTYGQFLGDEFTATTHARFDYVKEFGFSIITEELVDEIAKHLTGLKVIEIGSGTGWLAKHITDRHPNLNYTTSDHGDWGFKRIHREQDLTVSHSELAVMGYDAVVCSWPSYGCQEIAGVLDRLTSGTLFLYCGEQCGGCTGSDEMFDLLEEHFEELCQLESNLQFYGLHDQWILYKRK